MSIISELPVMSGDACTATQSMSENTVYVFSTSVESVDQVNILTPFLDALVGKNNWNFALDDCDHIFRLTTDERRLAMAINLLRYHGFLCEELND